MPHIMAGNSPSDNSPSDNFYLTVFAPTHLLWQNVNTSNASI